MKKTRKQISFVLKILITFFAFFAVISSCVTAVSDGYSAWHTRLYYFTQQSNIWIGFICLYILIFLILGKIKNKDYIKRYMYILKFIFTVSITITGIIFCSFLAPFADFDVWSFASILTHVVVPILSIVDFFVDDYNIVFNKKHIFLTLIPPFLYFVFSTTLTLLNVDFGRGDTFPYFFLNFRSDVGMFGYSFYDGLPHLGCFYWILFILGLILFLSFIYTKLHPNTRKNRKQKTL